MNISELRYNVPSDTRPIHTWREPPDRKAIAAGRVVKLGHQGAMVREIREKLNLAGVQPPLDTTDDRFTAEVDAAVRAVQAAVPLTVDGKVGPNTLGFLDALRPPAQDIIDSASNGTEVTTATANPSVASAMEPPAANSTSLERAREIAVGTTNDQRAAETAREVYQVERGDGLERVLSNNFDIPKSASAAQRRKLLHKLIQINKDQYPQLVNHPHVIHPDQKLTLPSAQEVARIFGVGSDDVKGASYVVYRVQPNDTAGAIASRFGISLELLDAANPDIDIETHRIKPGQTLYVPVRARESVHVVESGESVSSIAKEHGIADYQAIIRLNPRLKSNPNLIHPGWELLLPTLAELAVEREAAPLTTTTSRDTDVQPRQSPSAPAPDVEPLLAELRAGNREQCFVAQVAVAAMQSQASSGVPASVIIAQAALESGWGGSLLSRRYHNYFGMTRSGPAGSVSLKTWEFENGVKVRKTRPFAAYHNSQESFEHHGRLLSTRSRYAKAMQHTDNPREFIREVRAAGYATDPNYVSKIVAIMDRLDLYRFDR